MNARREIKERNLTWRIQEDSNCWTLLEHFLEPISCILYFVSKLRKSAIQRFKWCMNRSWNEEVRAIGTRSHQAKGQFRKLRNHKVVRVEWAMPRVAIRSNFIRIPQEDTWRTPLFGLPQGEAHGTREHHTLDDSISYPDMLSGSLTKVSKPCYVIPTACHSPCSAVLRWCVWTPCPNIFFHGFQRTLLNLGLLW